MDPEACGRSLGSAIILAAIKDYQSVKAAVHESASAFLYPEERAWQKQYDWAVALAQELNPLWLRHALDRSRSTWDLQRSNHLRSKPQRP
jgi:hypothetical protein